MPCIGTGNLSYPDSLAAAVLVEQTFKFLKQNSPKQYGINIVVNDQNKINVNFYVLVFFCCQI